MRVTHGRTELRQLIPRCSCSC